MGPGSRTAVSEVCGGRPARLDRWWRPPALLMGMLPLLGLAACGPEPEPALSPEDYQEAVTTFYVGLSAMQTTRDQLARESLERTTELAPREPAGWANLGLLLLRQQEIDQGAERLARAAALAPENSAVHRLLALAESQRGNLSESIELLRHSLELNPGDLEAAYTLASEIERRGGAQSEEAAQQILGQLLAEEENLAVRVEYLRLAVKTGDRAAYEESLKVLTAASNGWSSRSQEQLQELVSAPFEDSQAVGRRVAFFGNVLRPEPSYRLALAEVSSPLDQLGRPLTRFLRLENPDSRPAPPDVDLSFVLDSSHDATDVLWIGPVWPEGGGTPILTRVGPTGVQGAANPGRVTCAALSGNGSPKADSVAAVDLDSDFRVDFALAGPGGFCLLRQTEDGTLVDVTTSAAWPESIDRVPAWGLWPADVDTDGDLDLVLARQEGSPLVLRNNGDDTFAVREPFAEVDKARSFVWADLDGEGVPDAAFVDAAGRIRVFLNQRGGLFREDEALPTLESTVALAVGPTGSDGVFDLLRLVGDGTVTRLGRNASASWDETVITRFEPTAPLVPGVARLLTPDLDNNAAPDLVLAVPYASQIVLAGPADSWTPVAQTLELYPQAAADLDGDGRLELVGITADGRSAVSSSRGEKSYHWQRYRTRAATTTGDQRINSFGIGGEIEIRSGLHVQKQPITSPVVHFGLGTSEVAEVARITWPNGVLQSEFGTQADETVLAEQRLKGSCPWLFAWNGEAMGFVTDLLWRSPLGLRINAQDTADVAMTEDRVKIAGAQLSPRAGFYDLRVTAELWETHFFDLVSLLVVDHPEDTEIFVDERFAVPAPRQEVIATGPVREFRSVRDHLGHDVSELASRRDSRHVDSAGRGRYQGITAQHYVELELPEAAPRTGPLWLVGQGWIHPTDSSINVAISQGLHPQPEGLSLQVADGEGWFRPRREGLGFPAGKDKTVLIDLTDLFESTGARRLRLVTNLEIFWDRLGWAVGRPDASLEIHPLPLASAELAYRGYSATEKASSSSPERPSYEVVGTGTRWRDLEGYHTRFGEVAELLEQVDDRYVIMNAGDELRVRFPVGPPPSAGSRRDFVLISDGWEKDGDYNTAFSRTVLPLPTHATGRYDTPPGAWEEDPVVRAHPEDFAEYHTRYVAPRELSRALIVPPRRHEP